MDGPEGYTIDLGGLMPIPGLDCIVTADIDGVFDDLEPGDPDGFLTWDVSVEPGPGGDCSLISSGGSCTLIMNLDGDVY